MMCVGGCGGETQDVAMRKIKKRGGRGVHGGGPMQGEDGCVGTQGDRTSDIGGLVTRQRKRRSWKKKGGCWWLEEAAACTNLAAKLISAGRGVLVVADGGCVGVVVT